MTHWDASNECPHYLYSCSYECPQQTFVPRSENISGYDFYLGHCLWLGFPVDVMLDDSDLDQEMRYRLHAYVELTDQLIVQM